MLVERGGVGLASSGERGVGLELVSGDDLHGYRSRLALSSERVSMALFKKKLPPFPWEAKLPPVDVDRRYDVYYRLTDDKALIYRNIKFKEKRSLPSEGRHGLTDDFWLVEQEDGSELYLASFSMMLFCESGTKPRYEIDSLAK